MADRLAMDSTAAPIETGADAIAEDRDRGRSSTAPNRKVDMKVIGLGAGAAMAVLMIYSTFSADPKKAETAEEKRATSLAVNAAMEPAPDSAATKAGGTRNAQGGAAPSTVAGPPQTNGEAGSIVVPSINGGGTNAGENNAAHPTTTQGSSSRDMSARDQDRRYRLEAAQRRTDAVQARQAAMMHADVMVLNDVKKPSLMGGYEDTGTPDRGTGDNQTELAQRHKATKIQRVAAGSVGDRTFAIEAGRQMPCILQNALDSTIPGLVSCIIPENVRGANGQVVLLDKGTRVIGEYQGGMQQGQSRIFVIWNRAITPAGVSIALGSPGADSLGRAGLGGKTETFFWKRFGGALLISLVGDASTYVTSSVRGVNQVASSPNTAAAAAVENDVRIRPVLRAMQGQEMTIFAANDFDFSNVYSLRLKR